MDRVSRGSVLVRRGEIYWVTLDPTIGGEIRKTRPAIILSNNAANRTLNRVVMVSLTTNAGRLFPGEALVDVRGQQQKALASQLGTVSKERVGSYVDYLSQADIEELGKAVAFQLDLRIQS